MSTKYTIRRAAEEDLTRMIQLRTEAEAWLRERGIPQWTPDYDDYARTVLTKAVEAGSAWVVGADEQVIGTVSASTDADHDFWGWLNPVEQQNALYLSKMIVARSAAGLDVGSAILNWASQRAAGMNLDWIRLDVRRDNARLQSYYVQRRFEHVRTVLPEKRRTESGALFQRRAGLTTPSPIVLSC